MSRNQNNLSLKSFNEQILEKYQFFFSLPIEIRARAATATFISSFLVIFLIHLMLKSLLGIENILVIYILGVFLSAFSFTMILYPAFRQYFWLTIPLSFLWGGYIGFSSMLSMKTVSDFDYLTFSLSFTTLILIVLSGSLWNYVIRSVVEEKSKLDAEIDLAQTIQKDFLPTLNIEDQKVELYGKGEFATEVGGDYFDAFWMEDGKLIAAVGDVSGHNVAAGLLMAITKASFRAELRHFSSLENLMSELNNDLCDNSSPKMFVSFACALFDFKRHIVTVANAGHLPILFHQKNSGELHSLKPKAIALGLRHHARFSTETYPLEPGDRFLFFSDGVNETINESGNEFEIDGVKNWFKSTSFSMSAKELYKSLSVELSTYRGSVPLRDDSTILTVRCL